MYVCVLFMPYTLKCLHSFLHIFNFAYNLILLPDMHTYAHNRKSAKGLILDAFHGEFEPIQLLSLHFIYFLGVVMSRSKSTLHFNTKFSLICYEQASWWGFKKLIFLRAKYPVITDSRFSFSWYPSFAGELLSTRINILN